MWSERLARLSSIGLPWSGTPARRIEPEILDGLPAEHPEARRARKDLRRINAWMGNARHLARMLPSLVPPRGPISVVELGAGDGTLMLKMAKWLPWRGRQVKVQLVDRLRLLARNTEEQFAALGWEVRAVQAEVGAWLEQAAPVNLVVTNLFVHHFQDQELRRLLSEVARVSRGFAACEPRRFYYPRLAGSLVALVGCRRVARFDAAASVQAGFSGQELSALWPQGGDWELNEGRAGFFSHCFTARARGKSTTEGTLSAEGD